MSDIVLTKYVLVFILFSLINMNKIINQNWFRVYPKAGPVPEALSASFPWMDIVSVRLFDVAELSRCSADGRREVVEMILMFTWGTQVRPPGSRGRSRSRRSPGCRRSSRSGSEQLRQNAPQKPNCPLSHAGPSASRGSGGLLSLELCAQR